MIKFRIFKRRSIWFPTIVGWVIIVVILFSPALFWWFRGEAILSLTEPLPAQVLVVEGWIGLEAIHACATEFHQGGYQFIVATGSLSSERWSENRFSLAEMAERELVRSGVPKEKIIVATAKQVESQRTYESAVAVRGALEAHAIHPEVINIFTAGPHARRSRLIFAKACQDWTKVGVIAWLSPKATKGPWWRSSERAEEFLKETVGFAFEWLLNSGRRGERVH